MPTILSTKKLQPNQRDLLLGQGFNLVDYDAITIEFLNFDTPTIVKNAIFTSQNSVKSILKKHITIERVFCVGEKTKALLVANNFNVVETTNYGAALAQIISENYKTESFYFFCGKQRRDEIPNTLSASGIPFSEIHTYDTLLNPKKFEQQWDAILFYSPSGVKSYFKENNGYITNKEQPLSVTAPALICIGETTANAAKKYSNTIVIANTTLVESVIAKTVTYFKK